VGNRPPSSGKSNASGDFAGSPGHSFHLSNLILTCAGLTRLKFGKTKKMNLGN
jgi:hypothetical protein